VVVVTERWFFVSNCRDQINIALSGLEMFTFFGMEVGLEAVLICSLSQFGQGIQAEDGSPMNTKSIEIR